MDVVEAIDAWIDETIDDLSDDELETILEILDAVSDSRFANMDAIDVYDDDIGVLVDLVGGDSDERSHTDLVLRRALFGELDIGADDTDANENDLAAADPDGDPADLDDDLAHDDMADVDLAHDDMADVDFTDLDFTDLEESNEDASGYEAVDLGDQELGEPELSANDDADLEDPSFELTENADGKPASDEKVDDEFDDLAKFFADSDFDEAQNDSALEDRDTEDRDTEDRDTEDRDTEDRDTEDRDTDDRDSYSDSDSDTDTEAHDQEDSDNDDRDMDSDAVFLGDLFSAQTSDSEDSTAPTAHDDFLADVARASATAELRRPVAAAPLRPFDELGPAFLPHEPSPRLSSPRKRSVRLGQVVLPLFMLVGLAAFTFGMLQLINSLDESEAELAIAPQTTAVPTPAPTNEPASAVPTEAPLAAQQAGAESAPTPTPAPTPAPRVAIRLVTGDVMVATYGEPDSQPELAVAYDGSSEDEVPARHIAWLENELGVIDSDGNVFVVDLGQDEPEPTMIYEATGGLVEAAEIAIVGDLIAVRTIEGSIILTPLGERADPDILRVAWDGAEEGALAVNISSTGDLVSFVLDNGDARMIQTADDDSIVSLWSADPKPLAYNVSATADGVLLGIGEGTISRYLLGDVIGNRMESIWDPPPQDEVEDEDEDQAEDEAEEQDQAESDQVQLPAAGYSQVGDQTAVVLINGEIILVDADGEITSIWDPAITETQAFTAAGDGNYVLLLLETGSIVRVPLDRGKFIESVWDITDETLAPANQLAVEPLN